MKQNETNNVLADDRIGEHIAKNIRIKRLRERVWKLEAQLKLARVELARAINDNHQGEK